MKMPKDAYEALATDCKAVLEATEQGKGAFSVPHMRSGTIPARSDLTMTDMWDILLVVSMDRSHEHHPRHDYPGLLPRVVEYTGQASGWLWDRADNGGLDLNDSHIETALKAIMEEIKAEPAAEPEAAPRP